MIISYPNVSNGKERVSGYSHTYFDSSDANFNNLASFPSDKELNATAKIAYTEAHNLFSLLDVLPLSLEELDNVIRLPNITLWRPEDQK